MSLHSRVVTLHYPSPDLTLKVVEVLELWQVADWREGDALGPNI